MVDLSKIIFDYLTRYYDF